MSRAFKVDDNDLVGQRSLYKMRPKNIDLHDSCISYKNVRLDLVQQKLSSKSKKMPAPIKLSRHSYKMIDAPNLDYDQDSEEEFDDLNGEVIGGDDQSDQESADAEDLYDEGFIVRDDDFEELSETSYEDMEDGSKILKDQNRFQLKRENAKRLNEARRAMVRQKNLVMIEIFNKGSSTTDHCLKSNILTNLQGYEAVSFTDKSFPLKYEKKNQISDSAKKSKKKTEDHIIDKILDIAEIVQASNLDKKECSKLVKQKLPTVQKTQIDKLFINCIDKEKVPENEVKEFQREDSKAKKKNTRLSISSANLNATFGDHLKQDISGELKSIYEKNLKSDMPHFGESHQPANYSPFKSLQGSAQKPSGSNIALPPTVAQVGKSG